MTSFIAAGILSYNHEKQTLISIIWRRKSTGKVSFPEFDTRVQLPLDVHEFEKKAVEQLKAGKGYYERIVQKGDKRYLRAATPVPVVMKKCVMCHPHYEYAKKGEPIGVLSYRLEIE